jgi:hypothetical protein
MRDVDRLMALAAEQHGLFRADQARTCGLSRDWVAHREGDRMTTVLPGIYWARTGPVPRDVLLDAALLHCGVGAVLSHWTAAEIWGFRDMTRPEVHVTGSLALRRNTIPGLFVAHRSADLPVAVRRIRGGRPLTAVERTLVDLAAVTTSLRDVRAMTADVIQRGVTHPARLVAEMARRPSLPGLSRLGRVLEAVSTGARSVLEIELREHMASAGIPAAMADAPVTGKSGTRYRADNLWPDALLIVEVDGREWHLSPDDWERDLERAADLVDAGFRMLRFTAKAIRLRTAATVGIIQRQLVGQVTRAS